MGSVISNVMEDLKDTSTPPAPREPGQGDAAVSVLTLSRGLRGGTLPPEIIELIVGFSGLCDKVVLTRDSQDRGRDNENIEYMHVDLLHAPCMSITNFHLEIVSKDQGWSSYPAQHGTTNGSWTWWELALGEGVGRERIQICRNIHAGKAFHTFNFDLNAEDLDAWKGYMLSNGGADSKSIGLYKRSRYPGWRNIGKSASIAISAGPIVQQLIERYPTPSPHPTPVAAAAVGEIGNPIVR